MAGTADQIADLAEFLADDGGLKLWSLLVTLLGDLAQGGDDEVPGPVLSAVVERIGLQPQAMRVALHRLKRDGWIESRREARIGYYRLSAMGRAQTDAVRDRVYAPASPVPMELCLAIAPAASADPFDAIPDDVPAFGLTRRVFLLPAGGPPPPEDWFICELRDRAQPGWATELAAAAACETGFQRLHDRLCRISAAMPGGSAMDRLALRVLVLHGWRRLVLRSNPVAEAVLGPGAAALSCRVVALGLLAALPRPDPSSLLGEQG